MNKFIGVLLGVLSIFAMFAFVLALAFGSVEFLWWVFTGDFFHFVSLETASTMEF